MNKESLKHLIRIIGLISALSYISVIVGVWMYANIRGYIYFSGGEPLWFIKYPEWVLAGIAVYVIIEKFINELKDFKIKYVHKN